MTVLLLETGEREGAGEKEREYCVFHLLLGSYNEHRK